MTLGQRSPRKSLEKNITSKSPGKQSGRCLWQLPDCGTGKGNEMPNRKRRDRKPMYGMMIQLDGSPHNWLQERAGKCTLLVFIDSKILWLELVDSESTMALVRATKNHVEAHGIPQVFYLDHGGVFHVNLNNKDEEKKTQCERACAELQITFKHAHSPQAKGRVERCNGTLQDRLVKENDTY